MRSTPVGMRACVYVDLSKVCLFFTSFIGFMCTLRAFSLSGFQRVFYCRFSRNGFNEGSGGMGFWIWLVGFEGNEGRGCVGCEALGRAVVHEGA